MMSKVTCKSLLQLLLAISTVSHQYYWGEPERAPHRRDKRSQSIYYVYYIICMVRPSREIIYPVISTGINAKYSIAHSHAWDTGRIYVVLI